ncbi:MAG: hypothetical protein LBC43_01295 [Bifidobacteriaceae bacterium]|jgi:hypothetical protein|nr:hypothetical protein [Bifidobacteriaceae bacterium]
MSIAFQENDIYILEHKFHETTGSEKRPLVLTHVRLVNDFIVGYPIYSYKSYWKNYLEIKDLLYKVQDLKTAGLKKISYIDVTKQTILGTSDFTKSIRIGKLSPKDIFGLDHQMRHYIELQKRAKDNGRTIRNFNEFRDLMDAEYKKEQRAKQQRQTSLNL